MREDTLHPGEVRKSRRGRGAIFYRVARITDRKVHAHIRRGHAGRFTAEPDEFDRAMFLADTVAAA